MPDQGDAPTTDTEQPELAAPAAPKQLPRVLRPFRTAAYRRLALALVLSTFASGVWIVGLVWEVIRIGGGPAQLSVVSTASAIGVLLPALLAGVVADRVPQKTILLCVAGVELSGMAVVALLSLTGATQIWHLAVISFITGMGMAFYYPAYSAWLPALVPESDLMAVNGFEGMVRPTIGQAAGPAVAGMAVGAFSPGIAVAIAAASAAIGFVALTAVPKTVVRREIDPDAAPVHPVRTALTDMREGFVYMVRTPWLLATLLFASVMVFVIMGPLDVLVPFLIKDRLGGGPDDHAWVLAAFGIGGAVGSLTMASLPMPRRYLTTMNLTWGVGCLPMAVMGMASQVWVVVAAAFVLGAMFSAPMVIWGTLLQRRVPPALLGRVASLDFFVSISLMPVSMAVAGPVSEAIGLVNTFLIAGLVPAVVAAVAIVWAKLPQDELAHPLRD
ncbi:Predicted arabinose efflux permease, MFS family [Actinokineospora alba]|uniref:Predicted arabinose efflux permease, MFS family n=1 Tax=Actinokineospora alba TaxID=504798 RepID=A0A1H0FGS9_9PSEU|nr:MFS transporter [Actinokineospora alba]TDP69476.1 putative MFS family arabinose efflux permease [Actinokineospora alba]SDI15907.1 Predicted arabinose efflux permease, MFS family [Actinokineospora alba]SDN93883.1 Predicted arabinose efflux permease, MFS family [Actinokineospora alba]